MNVKIIWPDSIESIDTRADGSAALCKAALAYEWPVAKDAVGRPVGEVDVRVTLWSQLSYDEGDREETGMPRTLLYVPMADEPTSIIDVLIAATRRAKKVDGKTESRVLRLDVDGEAIVQAEPDVDVEG